MRIAYCDNYVLPVAENHKFPMEKYALLKEQLVLEGVAEDEHFFQPEVLDWSVANLAHCNHYLQQLEKGKLSAREQRKTGFEYSEGLIIRERTIMQGTLDAALFALNHGVGFNIAGGTHHAFSDRGEGFCLLNDFAIAAHYLLQRKLVGQVLIIDLDVHQGNGTAQIFQNEKRVFTFSIHGKDNYPLNKEQSDLDIEMPFGVEDEQYLTILGENLERLFDEVEPDIVFYQCGVDVLESDKLGKMSLSAAGCKERDKTVFRFCEENSVPVVSAMGGGYSPQVKDVVNAHLATFSAARDVFS